MYGKMPYNSSCLTRSEGEIEMARTATKIEDKTEDAVPAAKSPRQARLEARITQEQKALFERAAALEGRSITAFIVEHLQVAAEETIQRKQAIALTACGSEAVVRALLNPPEPNERLVEAFERHRDLIDSRS
jgi:uncharacterized protein (DUF1778 family)